MSTTQKQIAANQANAQHSTGPTSAEGKAKSSLNAVKSGLTGQTVLLPTDDVALYEAHLSSVTAHYSPVGAREQALVQSIANAEWRIQRVEALEFGMYAQGHLDYAADYANDPEPLRAGLIKAKTYLAYEKQLRNLQLQETRLRRHRRNDLDELAELQAERQAERDRQRKLAIKSLLDAFEAGTQDQWTPQENGFDFSIDEILPLAHSVRAQLYGAAAFNQRKKTS